MSPYHYFVIFLFVINVAAATVDSIRNQQVPTVNYPVDNFSLPPLDSIRNQQAPKVDYPVDFKLPPLNIDALTDDSYKTFITELINKAKGSEAPGNVPILPSLNNHLFDVVLRATDDKKVTHTVTVRFRRINLYVRGYQMETNKWMELREDKDDKLHMVDKNSEYLKFFGSYGDLVKAADKKVTEINFAKDKLKRAVVALSVSTNDKERAGSLIYMAQMISEAARFKALSSFFGSHIDKEKFVTAEMFSLVKDWSKYSKAVQCYDEYPKNYKFETVTILGTEYKSARELRNIFGIMLKVTRISTPKTCGIKNKLADEYEGEAAVVLSADM